MILRINSTFNDYNKQSFKGYSKKIIRNTSISLITGLLALSSCTNKKANTPQDTFETTEKTENIDSFTTSNIENQRQKVQRSYHYFPKNNNIINPEQYDWAESLYPDGSIVRDSLEYKIYISPDGKRTVTKTEKDEFGQDSITTNLPDGTTIIRQYHTPTKNKEIIFTEKTFRPDKSIKEIRFYDEYPTDSLHENSSKNIKRSLYQYNENNVLIKWESNISTQDSNKNTNKYDSQNRLVYDGLNNETYMYHGDNEIPYHSISENNGCKRITIYDKEGNIEKIYFEASDGTITE